MTDTLRVAVAGASGIGKHHAKWYHLAGCEVVGFLGSTPSRCAATVCELERLFSFSGQGYTDWETLLNETRPQIVDICLPNELHHAYAERALEAGCHVLCEKPLVWCGQQPGEEFLEKANALVDKAHERGLRFGVCTQYAVALPHYERLCGVSAPLETFYAEMETLARGRRRSPLQIWVDMGPHPLSLLLAWIPDGIIAPESLEVEFAGREARARFDFVSSRGCCRSELVVRDLEAGTPVRRFGINGAVVDCQGRSDESGMYRSVLSRGGQEALGEDFMSLLIGGFVEAVREPRGQAPVTGRTGLRNLELQVRIAQRALQS